ncbi:hypothetical protein HOC80_00080 [archaeon]|jgi:hypothetical protein|nr:hypothetical protein [archaeon]MBT4416481.1 hypothetical protein [archaeon]
MKKEDKFFLVVLATVILVRMVLFFLPGDEFFYNDYYHHIYFGMLLMFVFAFYNYEMHHKLFYPFAVAVGFIIDELIYLFPWFMNDINKEAYFSWYSLCFTAVGLIVVYVMRKFFVKEVNITFNLRKKLKRKE